YWELIHGGDQFDWRAINREHLEEKIENRLLLLGSKAVESYANGALAGEWIEKGSNDNAGNVRVTAYDPLTDAIYAIGDGGILFKGNLNGSGWQPLNDHYLLDRNVLQAIHLPDGTL